MRKRYTAEYKAQVVREVLREDGVADRQQPVKEGKSNWP
jgi:transposase-like protein